MSLTERRSSSAHVRGYRGVARRGAEGNRGVPAAAPSHPSRGGRRAPSSSLGSSGMDLVAPIVAVTVHPDRARVTRRGTVTLAAGPNELVVAGLPETLLDDSVRVAGRSENATSRARRRGRRGAPRPRRRARRTRTGRRAGRAGGRAGARRDRRRRRGRRRPRAAPPTARTALRRPAGPRAGRGRSRPGPGRGGVRGRRRAARGGRRRAPRARRAPGRRRTRPRGRAVRTGPPARLQPHPSRRRDRGRGRRAVRARRRPHLRRPRRGLDAAPTTPGSTASGPLALTWYGLVSQATGEDWPACELTLSTARPGVAGAVPELEPWWVDVRPPAPPMPLAAAAPARASST